jgi:catechol 2,3-dioxygenase-like lactoylglutathione lyase family enzyme
MAGRLTGSAPILLVADVRASAGYYRDRLGFEVELYGDPPDFGIAARGDAAIMLAEVEDRSRIVPHWRVREKLWNVYVWVDDAVALYEELRRRGATIDYSLYDAPHGCREFGVQDPDGYDIAFGQVLGEAR